METPIEKTPANKAIAISKWAMEDHELTPEELAERKIIRRRLYFGVRPGVMAARTPEIFLEDAKPAIFHFEMMTGTDMQEYRDQFYTPDGKLDKQKIPEAAAWTIHKKLTKPWENFVDRNGNQIPFERDAKGLTADCYASIPIQLRPDLMNIIIGENTVDPKEATGVKS